MRSRLMTRRLGKLTKYLAMRTLPYPGLIYIWARSTGYHAFIIKGHTLHHTELILYNEIRTAAATRLTTRPDEESGGVWGRGMMGDGRGPGAVLLEPKAVQGVRWPCFFPSFLIRDNFFFKKAL